MQQLNGYWQALWALTSGWGALPPLLVRSFLLLSQADWQSQMATGPRSAGGLYLLTRLTWLLALPSPLMPASESLSDGFISYINATFIIVYSVLYPECPEQEQRWENGAARSDSLMTPKSCLHLINPFMHQLWKPLSRSFPLSSLGKMQLKYCFWTSWTPYIWLLKQRNLHPQIDSHSCWCSLTLILNKKIKNKSSKRKIFELNDFCCFCRHISFPKVELAEACCLLVQAQRSRLFS